MRRIDPGTNWSSWRLQAKELIAAKIPPEEVVWEQGNAQGFLFDTPAQELRQSELERSGGDSQETNGNRGSFSVPAAFIELSKSVACHQDPSRWGVLYRLLWRIHYRNERHVLDLASDDDVVAATRMAKAVHREIHKMHAFVRFRFLRTLPSAREYYVAWFEPEHWIVERASPFFADRFTNFDWSIFTPRGCVHWAENKLCFTDAIHKDPIQDEDELQRLWEIYYCSIFNPARLKLNAMQKEMPKKYWKNLPEAKWIESLADESRARVEQMMEAEERPGIEIVGNAFLDSLKSANAANQSVHKDR